MAYTEKGRKKDTSILRIRRQADEGKIARVLSFGRLADVTLKSAGDVNVLITGSTRDTNRAGSNLDLFLPTQISSELEKILQGAGLGNVNVTLLDYSIR